MLSLVHSKLVVSVWPDQLSQIPAYQEECVGSENYSGTNPLVVGSSPSETTKVLI